MRVVSQSRRQERPETAHIEPTRSTPVGQQSQANQQKHSQHHHHRTITVEMAAQISIMLMIASASSQQVESQEATGSEQLSALEQAAALVEKQLALDKEAELARPHPAQPEVSTNQLQAAHRAHLARFLKTAIGNKQRELADATEQPELPLRRATPTWVAAGPQQAKPAANEGAMVRLLLSELSTLDLGRTTSRAGKAKASSEQQQASSTNPGPNQQVGKPSSNATGAVPANNIHAGQRRHQQQNRHIPCFFNAITCF